MITGKVSPTPKNVYLRCDGKVFNSSLGCLSSEGNTLSSIGGNGSNLGAHPVTPHTRGSVDYPSTRGILVNVGRHDIFHENWAESPLYRELYLNTKPA